MCGIVDNNLSSSIGFKGICRKVIVFMLVGVATILDTRIFQTGSVLRTAVIFFYLSNEGISLLENASHLGLPIPMVVKKALNQLHDKSENKENENGKESISEFYKIESEPFREKDLLHQQNHTSCSCRTA